MKTNRKDVYDIVDSERNYQTERWSYDVSDCGGIEHSNVEFLVYIRDYVEEALHYASRNPEQNVREFTKHTMRKVAALAVAAMEQNGALKREINL
jgi:hypothetical protein